MKSGRIVCVMVCGLMGVWQGRPATIAWDGDGGDLSWQNATNWSGNVLPGLNDDAVIDVASDATITSGGNVTILSLQCSNNLALSSGTFRVRSGSSVVQGRLLASGNPVLSATGALTSFTVNGPVSADGAGFEAIDGTISLPGLANYSKGAGCAFVIWVADGATGVLDLPGLTNVTGATCANLNIQALDGGTVRLDGLTTTGEGVTLFIADGAGSLIDLAAARQSFGTTRAVSFEARNNAAISMPQFVGGTNVSITLKTGGAMPVARFRELSGFAVTGTNVDFVNLTNLTSGNVTVNGGSVVSATNLLDHGEPPGCTAHTWLVSGVGSVLDLAGITNLTGPNCGYLNIQATAGGAMILSNLTTVTEGILSFVVDGSDSLVDLGRLNQLLATGRTVSFEAQNDGTIEASQLVGGPTMMLTLETGGVFSVAQLTELRGFTVTGMPVEFTALTNLTSGNVTVDGGGTVSLPALTSHDESIGCYSHTWLASGPGSVLDLSHLATLAGAGCGALDIEAVAGGTMMLSNLAVVTEGTVNFTANGANSVVDLRALEQSFGTARTVAFEARNAGTILAPLLSGGESVTVALRSGGVLPVAQLRQLKGFTVDGMIVDIPSLTNLTSGNVTVSGGGTVSAPGLHHYAEPVGCRASTWLVSGAGSVLDFSGLTNLTGATCGYLDVHATAGGTFQLGGLTTVTDGTVNFLADGTNSLVDLTNLVEVLATSRTVSFEARNDGTIAIPRMQGGPTVTVAIKSGGSLDAMQLNLLKGLTVSGTSLNLPGITNLFTGDLTVDQGAQLTLPNLFSHDQGSGCTLNTWKATGAGSALDLSSLTNLVGSSCGALSIQALAGGTVIASDLREIADGTLEFIGDGAGSTIDLAALERSPGTFHQVTFEVRNAGSISMPLMTGGPTVGVTIKTNGTISVSALARLGAIEVSGTNVDFPNLTNIDGGRFSVTGGATVTAPNLNEYAQGGDCQFDTWLVNGTNSVLNLPGLTTLAGGTCGGLDAQALGGGHLLLGNLEGISHGTVYLLASGGGSLIDLHSLSNYLHASSLSKLAATGGGTILLNSPLFFSGVALNFAAGSPGLPTLDLAGTNLVLHGLAWHSYWTETRDTSSPVNPWQFFQRVPLTNDFQIIGPPAPANRVFRGWEFVADPFALELTLRPGLGVQPVLYGPAGVTLEIQATTNLAPVAQWETCDTVAMTNTFRILPPEPTSTPERYFKVNAL